MHASECASEGAKRDEKTHRLEVRNHVHHVGANWPINIITPFHAKHFDVVRLCA